MSCRLGTSLRSVDSSQAGRVREGAEGRGSVRGSEATIHAHLNRIKGGGRCSGTARAIMLKERNGRKRERGESEQGSKWLGRSRRGDACCFEGAERACVYI